MHSSRYKFLVYLYVTIFMAFLVMSVFLIVKTSAEAKLNAYGAAKKVNIEVQGLETKNIEACKSITAKTVSDFGRYLDSLDKVVIHSDSKLRRGLANASVIYVRCLPDLEEYLNVLVHEIGHVIDLGYLVDNQDSSNSQFKDFNQFVKVADSSYKFYSISWKTNKEHNKRVITKDFVSIYASEDPFEDFAESFMLYVRYPEKFAQYAQESDYIMKKYIFIRDNIFEGENGLDINPVILSSFELEQNRLYDATQIHKN